MVSGADIWTHTPGERLIQEDRSVDTPGLRLAEVTGRMVFGIAND